jgi:aldehyde dehydrogenase (NAD+)
MHKRSAHHARGDLAPILYVVEYEDFDEAIAIQNGVSQGLSSRSSPAPYRRASRSYPTWASDCGIANVNIGTSGAEIGGAFGGEKDTAAGENPARMRGRPTCGGRRTPSIGVMHFPLAPGDRI